MTVDGPAHDDACDADRGEDGGSVVPPVEAPGTAPPPVRTLVAVMERARRSLGGRDGWPSVTPDGWLTCDGGAVLAAHAADLLGIERRLVVGVYWHATLRSYCRTVGERLDAGWHVGPDDPVDEHHHWTLLRGAGSWWLFDPNGPCRDEPFVQPSEAASGRYVPTRDFIVYDPSEPVAAIARGHGYDVAAVARAVDELRR